MWKSIIEGIRVLIVDDEPDILEQAKIFLENEKEEFDIETASSAKEALEKLDKQGFDAIVSDYQMPGMDGMKLLEEIRNRGNNTPFIVFTGRGSEKVAKEALNIGADRYLQKGGDPKSQYGVLADAILQKIEHWHSKIKYENLFETTPELISQVSEDGTILTANQSFADSFNLTVEEVLGKKIQEMYPDETGKKRLEKGKEAIRKNKTLVHEDEVNGRHFHIIYSPVDLPGEKNSFIGFAREITKRKEMEGKLKKSEEKYRKTIENANVGVGVYGGNKKIEVLNPKMKEIIGYTEEETPTLGQWFKKLYPDKEDRKEISELWMDKISEKGEISGLETEITRKDGSKRNLLFNGVQLESGDVIFFAQDITERKVAEERKEFLHSMLRHDLKNKISIVRGYIDLLKETELSTNQKELLENAINALQNSDQLIEKVRTLRKVEQEEEVRDVNLKSMLNNAIEEYKILSQEEEVEIESEVEDYRVRGGPLLEEMFGNLLENCLRHAQCKKIRISSKNINGQIKVRVEDDGCGIPEEDKSKIFIKGYKKGESSGSGLGLHICQRIAENYDGDIEIEDSELGGAKFNVYLNKG